MRVSRNRRVTRRGRMIDSNASHTTTRKTATPAMKIPGTGIMRSIVLGMAVLRNQADLEVTSCELTVICALNSFDTGQPVSAAFTAASNLSLSALGTWATRSRWLLVIEKPSPTFSSEMVQVVSSLVAVRPAPPSCAERAMVKQPACAAASNSSGLVPTPLSKRELNEYCVFFSVPLSVEISPLPDFKSPCQTAEALRCMDFSFSSASCRPERYSEELDIAGRRRVTCERPLILPSVKDEKSTHADKEKAHTIVPAKTVAKVGDGEHRKHGQGNHLLNRLELRAAEFVRADAVCGHLEAVLEKRDAPT